MRLATVCAAASLLLLPACGDDEGSGDPGPPVSEITVVSDGLSFEPDTFAVRPGDEITVTYDNRHDGVEHNIHFQFDDGGEEPQTDLAVAPDVQEVTFTAPESGEETFVCDTHVAQMQGTLVVVG